MALGASLKHYGTAAGSLLEAEVVTADGEIRIANACTNPDLFWALKGGGGGSFGVVSKMTLRVHELPEFFGVTNFTVKAASDDAYRGLIREFVSFYQEHLFNDHWGEQAHVNPENTLEIRMAAHGLDGEQAKKVWQPFLDWVADSSHNCSLKERVTIGSVPARHWWDVQWWKEHWPEIAFPRDGILHGLLDDVLLRVIPQPALDFDNRSGADPNNAWWKGDGGQVAWFIWGFESLWMPASLLESDAAAASRRRVVRRVAAFRFRIALQQGTRRRPARGDRAIQGYGDESGGADRVRARDRGRRAGTGVSGNSRA